jgi:asparagine synthase (glutamine-hydrolysing)
LHLMEERMRSALPLGLRRPLFGALGSWYPKADWAPRMFRAKTTFEALARDAVEAYFHTMSLIREPMRSKLYSDAFKSELGDYSAIQVFRDHAANASTDDPLALIQYIDTHTYLVGDINTKVDRASMAHSLEVREPLMDHKLVEWLATLPSSLKMRGRDSKFLLKKAMEPHLPRDIMYRPKMGFAVPLERWFRGPLRQRVRAVLLEGRIAESGMFNPATIHQILEQHDSRARDHSMPIWTLLMFDAFLRCVVDESQSHVPVVV